jgi:ubiquinone/menaquinone biosynthesis C-methylase UbiE
MEKKLQELSPYLKCPLTQQSLRVMNKEEIEFLNKRIAEKKLLTLAGLAFKKPIDAAFITLDGSLAYPIVEGIAIFLPDRGLIMEDEARDRINLNENQLKENVQNFYDELGWQQEEENYVDALLFEDLRAVSQDYIHQCHLRVNRHIKDGGKYILDAASGPIQYPEYLTYSENFEYRICVDISFRALQEAKRKLGDRGIYILADITKLPIKNNSLDSAVSLHTIYHVPENEQSKAIAELYRVIKSDSAAIIIYDWGKHSLAMNVTDLPYKVISKFRRIYQDVLTRSKRKSTDNSQPTLYYYPHGYKWVIQQANQLNMNIDILSWRSVSVFFMRSYIHQWLWGKQILKLIYFLEEKLPKLTGILGRYPMVIIKK